MFSVQVHSVEAAAQPWGTNSCQEVSPSDSLVAFHTFDGAFSGRLCTPARKQSPYASHKFVRVYLQSEPQLKVRLVQEFSCVRFVDTTFISFCRQL